MRQTLHFASFANTETRGRFRRKRSSENIRTAQMTALRAVRFPVFGFNKYSLRVSPETHVVGSRSKNFSGQINRNCVTDLDKARTVWKWIDFTASKAYCPHDLPVFSLTCGSPSSRRPTVNDFSTAGSRRSLRQERQA